MLRKQKNIYNSKHLESRICKILHYETTKDNNDLTRSSDTISIKKKIRRKHPMEIEKRVEKFMKKKQTETPTNYIHISVFPTFIQKICNVLHFSSL